MISSWFNQKSTEESGTVDQPRRSFDQFRTTSVSTAYELQPPRSSLDNPRPSKRSQPPYSTPHDAIIAQFHVAAGPDVPSPSRNDVSKVGHVNEGDEVQLQQPNPTSPEPNASYSRVNLGLSPTPSTHTNATANLRYTGNHFNAGQPQTADLLLDPFDGTSHGVLVPQDVNMVPHGEITPPSRFNSSSVAAAGEAMWSHLSRVLDLQSQIAKMHTEMEGIGLSDGRKGMKGKMSSIGKGVALAEERKTYHGGSRLRARAMSNVSTVGSEDGKEGDEEGVGVTDEEAEKNRAREEEFAKLADQFEGKKESIRDIMNKLDDLSKALTEFHALQVPEVAISSSRHSSMGVTANQSLPLNNPSAAPSHAPLPPSIVPNSENALWSPNKMSFSPISPSVLPQSLSRITPQQPAPQRMAIPTVLVNSMASEARPLVMDSPASTLGSLLLHDE